jgi:hypothetical protein
LALTTVPFRPGLRFPSPVYLDTNLVMHSRDIASWKHTAARVCLGELTTQLIDVCVSSLMIDELWWSLLGLQLAENP